MAYVIVALFVVIAWQHTRLCRLELQASTVFDADDSDDTLRELAFAECAICESMVTVMPETHGPSLCCYCRADFREEADGLPLPSESEVNRLLARAKQLADETLRSPLN